jgi:hypothetical protein
MESPRIIATTYPSPEHVPDWLRSKFFVGHIKAIKNVEIISFNDEMGRFEFQIIENFGTSKAKVYYAKRSECISCHKNEGPIFSTTNWGDIFSNISGGILQYREKLKMKDSLDILKYFYPGLEASLDSEQIDQTFLYSNKLLASQIIWNDGCVQTGYPVECRRQLLQSSIDPNFPIEQKYLISKNGLITTFIARKILLIIKKCLNFQVKSKNKPKHSIL